jgi:hypothetical protein
MARSLLLRDGHHGMARVNRQLIFESSGTLGDIQAALHCGARAIGMLRRPAPGDGECGEIMRALLCDDVACSMYGRSLHRKSAKFQL